MLMRLFCIFLACAMFRCGTEVPAGIGDTRGSTAEIRSGCRSSSRRSSAEKDDLSHFCEKREPIDREAPLKAFPDYSLTRTGTMATPASRHPAMPGVSPLHADAALRTVQLLI